MQTFSIEDSRPDDCGTCCCFPAGAQPGSNDKWVVDYSPLIMSSGSTGLIAGTNFALNRCDCSPEDKRLLVQPLLSSTLTNTPLLTDLSDLVDPTVQLGAEYTIPPLRGPKRGTVAVDKDTGDLTYTPTVGAEGYDRFFFQVKLADGNVIVQEAVIGVGRTTPGVGLLTPDMRIVNPKIDRMQLVFGMEVSPAARIGDRWTLNVEQGYFDCDGCYSKLDCFDITIGKC